MKRLVVDGNSVYEIDEDCVRRRHPPKECEIYQYFMNNHINNNGNSDNYEKSESIKQ